MMVRRVQNCLIGLVLISSYSCQKIDKTPDAEQTDEKITDEEIAIAKSLIQGAFDDLWAGLDSTKILNYHTADFIILENGEVWDNERIIQFMRERGAVADRPFRANSMDYISIDKYGPSIQIAYHNYAKFTKGDSIVNQASWLESALAVPTDKGWRLKMMHSTWSGRDFVLDDFF